MAYLKLVPPTTGEKITARPDGTLNVPDNPVIPFIEGDGTGPDIWASAVRVMDAAIENMEKKPVTNKPVAKKPAAKKPVKKPVKKIKKAAKPAKSKKSAKKGKKARK